MNRGHRTAEETLLYSTYVKFWFFSGNAHREYLCQHSFLFSATADVLYIDFQVPTWNENTTYSPRSLYPIGAVQHIMKIRRKLSKIWLAPQEFSFRSNVLGIFVNTWESSLTCVISSFALEHSLPRVKAMVTNSLYFSFRERSRKSFHSQGSQINHLLRA